MCGIAGLCSLQGGRLPAFDPRRVLDTLRHRGPDEEGMLLRDGLFLGVRRLAIIDPERGHQPFSDESGRYHLVMNGEIFDYDLFLKDLQARGHRFTSHCDAEVLVHLIEQRWSDVLEEIDGQYAFAAWDERERRLLLARDRMGICPLFYAVAGDWLVFASEMKAIFATGLVQPALSRRSLDAVLAFGATPAPNALFEGIRVLPPGRFLLVQDGRISEHAYWDIPYNDAGDYPRRPMRRWAAEFRDVLAAACRRRLKADVPVGVYLSGGIDSGTIAALVADRGVDQMKAFTIGFPEPGFDESGRALAIADRLGFRIHLLRYSQGDLAADLPQMVYHGETPIVSTESVPLMALSRLAAEHVKVVLTGEGADEALGGYLYFRWEALKALLAGEGRQRLMTLLARPFFHYILGERNPFVPQTRDLDWACHVFGYYPAIMMKFFYFRMIRQMVYSPQMLSRQARLDDAELVDLPLERMRRWEPYNRTLYLSSRLLMTSHLLGSHGDRALMANSVEGRYPFLDRTVQEFLAAVPPALKTSWITEKRLLRRAMAPCLPAAVSRHKKPFLAPFGTPFVGEDATEYIRELLTPGQIEQFGYFDPAKVRRIAEYLLREKQTVAADRHNSIRPNRKAAERLVAGMALTFVVSTQILADQVRQGLFGRRAADAAVESGPSWRRPAPVAAAG